MWQGWGGADGALRYLHILQHLLEGVDEVLDLLILHSQSGDDLPQRLLPAGGAQRQCPPGSPLSSAPPRAPSAPQPHGTQRTHSNDWAVGGGGEGGHTGTAAVRPGRVGWDGGRWRGDGGGWDGGDGGAHSSQQPLPTPFPCSLNPFIPPTPALLLLPHTRPSFLTIFTPPPPPPALHPHPHPSTSIPIPPSLPSIPIPPFSLHPNSLHPSPTPSPSLPPPCPIPGPAPPGRPYRAAPAASRPRRHQQKGSGGVPTPPRPRGTPGSVVRPRGTLGCALLAGRGPRGMLGSVVRPRGVPG